jgi:hypothetical protein
MPSSAGSKLMLDSHHEKEYAEIKKRGGKGGGLALFVPYLVRHEL